MDLYLKPVTESLNTIVLADDMWPQSSRARCGLCTSALGWESGPAHPRSAELRQGQEP